MIQFLEMVFGFMNILHIKKNKNYIIYKHMTRIKKKKNKTKKITQQKKQKKQKKK